MTVRILIADDHAVLRSGLRMLLSQRSDMEVVGEIGDGTGVLSLVQQCRPDIVLLDFSMPGRDGLAITRELKQAVPDVRILILTGHEDDNLFRESVEAGASGFVVKRAVEEELIEAIQAIIRGEMYVHPSMTRALLGQLRSSHATEPNEETLTPRESEVLRLIVRGFTNGQIAEATVLSVRTVESHRASIMRKLRFHSRAELVKYAMDHGIWTE